MSVQRTVCTGMPSGWPIRLSFIQRIALPLSNVLVGPCDAPCLVHISRRMTSFSAHVVMSVWSPKPLPPPHLCLSIFNDEWERMFLCWFQSSSRCEALLRNSVWGVNFPACCWCKYSGKLTEPPPTNTYRYTHGTVPWLLLLFGLLCWFTGLQSTHHLRRKWTLRKVSREGCILEVGACPEW